METMDTFQTMSKDDPHSSRLKEIKQNIQKIARESYKQVKLTTTSNDDSFALGLALFGQETSVLEKTVQDQLHRIENELNEIVEKQVVVVENEGADEAVQIPREQLEAESEQLRQQIVFLSACSEARGLLDEAMTQASIENNLEAAAACLTKASKAWHSAKSTAPGMNAEAECDILDSIQDTMRRYQVDFLRRGQDLWTDSVTITEDSITVKCSDDHGLKSMFALLAAMGNKGKIATEDILRDFTRAIQHQIFQPLLESHKAGKVIPGPWTFREVQDRISSSLSSTLLATSKKGYLRCLEWSCEDRDDSTSLLDPLASWKETFAFFQRVLVFIAEHVLMNNPAFCDFVGKRFLGKPDALKGALNLEFLGIESRRLGDDNGLLLEPLLDILSQTCLPEKLQSNATDSLTDNANLLRSIIDPFVKVMIERQFITSEEPCRLSKFVHTFEQRYVDKRRCKILNDARCLLVENDYHNTVVVGVDARPNKEDELLGLSDGMAVFKLHKSSISDTAFKLMKLCRQTMEEAVEHSAIPADSPLSHLPGSLYQTSRDVLDLFRAIIPVTHGREIANVPRTAAVLHNDCVYFAYHCLTLGLEYKERFANTSEDDVKGNLLRQTCIFVDMVPLFRELAERAIGDMLKLQAEQMSVLVGDRITLLDKALRSEETLAEWSDAETALEAGLYHLRHLNHAWKPVLSYEVLNRSLCYLADVVFTLYLDKILKAKDISSEACQFLFTLFQKANAELSALVEHDKSSSIAWDRFWAIGKFMDMSLADIEIALTEGVFRSVTGPELKKLITACFDDSQKRKHVLKLVSTS